MKAITVEPHRPETAHLEDIPEPDPRGGSVLVEAVTVGVCGTNVEIVNGKYGWALGAGRVSFLGTSLWAACSSGVLQPGDLVVGIVRRPGAAHVSALRSRATSSPDLASLRRT
jgi:glucose 1-dehydrogenase